jgi:hypothetical protein
MVEEARNKMDDIIADNFSWKGIICDVKIGNVLKEVINYQNKKKV